VISSRVPSSKFVGTVLGKDKNCVYGLSGDTIRSDHSPYTRALFTFCLYTYHTGCIQTKVYYLDKIAHVRVGSVDRLCL
jgi:hypothetical protein